MSYIRNSPWLDITIKLGDNFNQSIELLSKDIDAASGGTGRIDSIRNITNVLSVIYANILRGELINNGCNYQIRLSNRSYPSGDWNPYNIGIRSVKKAIDFLKKGEDPYIILSGGNHDKLLNISYPTQLSPTHKMLKLILNIINDNDPNISNPIPITRNTFRYNEYVMFYDKIFQSTPLPPIRLREGSSKYTSSFISFVHTIETINMESCLDLYNTFINNNWIDIFIADSFFKIPFSSDMDNFVLKERQRDSALFDLVTGRSLYRVFNNGKFTDGGRFYGGWWQGIRSEYRRFITINDIPTVELDFSGMQIAMLYAMIGQNLVGDPYTLDGVHSTYRSLIKTTTLQLINAKGRMSAPRKLALPSGLTWRELQDAIIQRHAPIAEFLGSGEGIRLQRLDSDIAEDIMMGMLERGIVTLPIHDSFIVPEGNEDELREVMASSYRRQMGRDIELKRSPSLFDDLLNDQPDLIGYERQQLAMERFHKLKQRPEYEGYRRRQEWASGTLRK